MSPAPNPRAKRGGKGGNAPANRTADRLDSVLVGQLVHLDAPTLGSEPTDGWLTVKTVQPMGDLIMLGFDAPTEPFVGAPNRLVRIGW